MYNNYGDFAENNVSFALLAQNAVKDYWNRASENFFWGINQVTNNVNSAWKNFSSFSSGESNSCNQCGTDFLGSNMQLATELATSNLQNNIYLASRLESGYREIYSNKRTKC